MKTLNFIEAVKLSKETGKEFYSENWSNPDWRVFFDNKTKCLKAYGDLHLLTRKDAKDLELDSDELLEYLEDERYVMVSNTQALREFMEERDLDKQSLLELIKELDNE